MLDKVYACAQEIEPLQNMYSFTESLKSTKENYYYSVLYSTNPNECFDKPEYIAIHYAKKKSFSVYFLNTQERIIIKENTFFIAKRASNYKLLQHEAQLCSIVTILINTAYFATELLTLLEANRGLALFLNSGDKLYTNPDFSEISILEKEYFNKLLDTIPLQDISSQDYYQDYMNLVFKRIILYIDYHFKTSILDCVSFKAKIINYINNDLKSASLLDLASKWHYTTPYLSQKIIEATGKKFSLLLKDERIKKGKELLEETDLSLKEIIVIIGYENESSFVAAFKEIYKLAPIAYRKAILNDAQE